MLAFVVFIVAVTVYITFLLWCFAPLVRKPKHRWTVWPRLIVGSLLLGANFIPLLAWPFLWPIYAFGQQAPERALAIVLFPRTLPIYIGNVIQHASATADIVEIEYPISIDGIRYAPVVRTACTARGLIAIDKGTQILSFSQYPTAFGGELVAQTKDAIVVIAHSNQLCSMVRAGKLKPGPVPDYRSWIGFPLTVYVVRGQADQTQLYQLPYRADAIAADDIVLQPPEIVRIDNVSARDVISLEALWPMDRKGEMSRNIPALIEAYERLPAGVNACVLYVTASWDFKANTARVGHTQRTKLREVPVAERPIYCRDALLKHIPPTAPQPLAKVEG
jgi:hypothetical protein